MFIIIYVIIGAAACGMVYLGYLQGTSRFYMAIFSAAVVLYCIYLDFKSRREKKKEEKTTSASGKKQPKLTSASKVKGGEKVGIRNAAHKSTKDRDIKK